MNDTQNPVIKMTNICKTYPGVKALQNVNFDLRAGEVHSICGENGAGKSTLIKILTGAETYDENANCHIYLDGSEIAPKSTQQAQELGISTVYQEVNLCPNLTVAENIFVGRQPMIGAAVDWKKMTVLAEKAMRRLNLKLDVTAPLNEYSVAIQQMVAIVRAVDVNAKVLVLDEPTAGLDPKGRDEILDQVERLHRETGMTVILVSHSMEDVARYVERIIVMNHGEKMLDGPPSEVFRHYKELEQVGLAAPQVTYVMHDLKDRGFPVSPDATTIEEAAEEIMRSFQ